MFFHLFKYKLLDILRQKEDLFWCSMFPIILGTLFFFGFGNLMNGKEVEFTTIPVAVVKEEENIMFETVLSNVSDYTFESNSTDSIINIFGDNNTDNDKTDENDTETALFAVTATDLDNAKELLKSNNVDAIIHIKAEPELSVDGDDFNVTIAASFINQYLSTADVIENTIKNNPAGLKDVINALSSEIKYSTEKSLTSGTYDPYIQYFYALIAMACLFCTMTGARSACSLQANMSALGMRREAAATHKFIAIMADFAAVLLMQCIYFLMLIAYLTFVLGINFGDRVGFVILTGFVGNIIGISAGFFIGCAVKKSVDTKVSICSAVSMISCFLSGLMIHKMKDILEHTCPIINRINPATLITDCLYALNMYDDFSRFTVNIATMLVMAVIFCIGSYLLLRRNNYADL